MTFSATMDYRFGRTGSRQDWAAWQRVAPTRPATSLTTTGMRLRPSPANPKLGSAVESMGDVASRASGWDTVKNASPTFGSIVVNG